MSAGSDDGTFMTEEQEFLAAAAARAKAKRDVEQGLDQDQEASKEPEVSPAPQSAGSSSSDNETSIPADELDRLTEDMIAAIKTVYDPEIPVDIYELGLIYKIDVDDDRNVEVDMTLTAPACPVAGDMPVWVENAVRSVAGVQDVKVNLVFDPPWDMSKMSEEARVALNMF